MLLLLLGARTDGVIPPDGRGHAGGDDARLDVGGVADSRIDNGGAQATGLGSAGGSDE